jgi:PAS domain S-box-containing protein
MKKSDGTGEPPGKDSQIRQSIIQNANVWLVVLDPHGRILEWNLAAEAMSGFTAGEVLGKNDVWKLLYPDTAYRKTITGTITRVIGNDQFFENFETSIRTKTGTSRTISWNTRAIPDETGKPARFVAIGIDVTPRKRLEMELTQVAREWESTFNATSDGICLIGADMKIQRCNRRMSEILGGIPQEKLTGKSCFEIVHGTPGPVPECPVVAAKKSLVRTRSELFERGRWFEMTADPILDSAGAFTGAVHIMRDITERKQAELALRESEEKYHAFFTTSRDCIFITTPDGHWTDFNDAAVELFGFLSREDLQKTTSAGIYANPADLELHLKFIREHGYSFEYPVNLKKKDGALINALVTTVARKDVSGTIIGFQGSVRDVTRQNHAEEALRTSEARLETLVKTIPDLVWLKDKDGVFLTCNTMFERFFGAPSADIIGKTDYDFVDRGLADFFRENDLKAMAAGKPTSNEEWVTFADDGHRVLLETTKTPMIDSTGVLVGVLGVGRDITERKRAEDALKESEAYIKSVLDSLPIGVAVNSVDPSVSFRYMNDNFPRFYRTTREALARPDSFWEAVYEDPVVRERFRKRVIDDCAAGDPERMYWQDIPITRRGEETTFITARNVLIPDKNLMISTVWDVTARKQAEEALRQNRLELANAMDLAGIVNWEYDVADGMFTFDDRFYAFYGTTAEREGGFRMSADTYTREFVYPVDIPRVAEEIGNLLATTDPQYRGQMEHRIIRRNGEIRTILARYAPVISEQGTVVRTFGANQDITERKQIMDALSQSRQIFADIISFLPDPTFVINDTGNVLAWNRALEQLSGVLAADIIGKGDYEYSLWQYGKRRPILIDLVQAPEKDYARINYRDIIQQDHTVIAETDLILPGKKIILSLVASPLLDEKGTIIGAIESMRDITRIKETEAELSHINAHLETLVQTRTHALEEEVSQRRSAEQKVEELFRHTRSVIEANPDLMVVIDPTGIIQDVNAATEQMIGLPREKLIGTSYNSYLIARSDAKANLAQLFRDGTLRDIPYDLRRTDGSIIPILANSRIQRGRDGNVESIIASAHDITRQKKDAEEIKASLDEKIILLREVHHRVKNNLQIIISLTNLQLRQVEDPQMKQYLSETKNRVRAMSLVHEKLYQSESLSHIDLADYLRYLSSQLFSYYSTDSRRVNLVVEVGKATVDINTAIPLGLIVNELVSNALRHAFPGDRKGTITLAGGLVDDVLTLSVSDDGVGIPSGYDWKNAKSLGLRLVNILTDQIDGTITVPETPGTMFIITVRLKP